MTPEIVFQFFNTLVLPQWFLMIFLPNLNVSKRLVKSFAVPILLGLGYIALIVMNFHKAEGGGFMSLQEVKQLFSVDFLIVAGWIHYLTFDLVVGTWILTDSQKRNIRHAAIIPCLIGTFIFGPAGFVLYQIIRNSHIKPEEFRKNDEEKVIDSF